MLLERWSIVHCRLVNIDDIAISMRITLILHDIPHYSHVVFTSLLYFSHRVSQIFVNNTQCRPQRLLAFQYYLYTLTCTGIHGYTHRQLHTCKPHMYITPNTHTNTHTHICIHLSIHTYTYTCSNNSHANTSRITSTHLQNGVQAFAPNYIKSVWSCLSDYAISVQ